MASGRRLGGGLEGDQRWEHRIMETPSIAMSFQLGDYDLLTRKVGHVDLTLAFNRSSSKWMSDKDRDRLHRNVQDVLEWSENAIGPYPLDELTVVISEENFAQGLIGFVTLPESAIDSWAIATNVSDYRVILAHELAHQWWGNLVIPAGPRDVWLSEGMAEYLATIYARQRSKRTNVLLVSPLAHWRSELTAGLKGGRTVEDVGPLVLGQRLSSTLCSDCYERIVYTKGAMVLDTLGQLIGQDRFLEILRAVVAANVGQPLTTEAFIASVQRKAGIGLDGFRQRYVEGTGMPFLFYSYEFTPAANGRWKVKLGVDQEPSYRRRYSVVRDADGTLDVRTTRDDQVDISLSNVAASVEIHVINDAVKAAAAREKKPDGILRGSVVIRGPHTDWSREIDCEPVAVRLADSTLASMFCESCRPRETLNLRAGCAMDAGRLDEAEDWLRQALAAPVSGKSDDLDAAERLTRRRWMGDAEAAVWFSFSRLRCLQGRYEEAQEMLDKGRRAIASDAARWVLNLGAILEARLKLRRGEVEQAHRLLWREVLNGENHDTEAYILLAIAAQKVGDDRAYRRALAIAKERGADVSILESQDGSAAEAPVARSAATAR